MKEENDTGNVVIYTFIFKGINILCEKCEKFKKVIYKIYDYTY